MKYTIYDTSTGKILRHIECDASAIQLQCDHWMGSETVSWVENHYSGSEYKITNGQAEALSPKPGPFYFWNHVTNEWAVDTDLLVSTLTRKRSDLLAQTDWLVTRQQETGVSMPAEWLTYRQQLRDITQQSGWPTNVIWPTPPV